MTFFCLTSVAKTQQTEPASGTAHRPTAVAGDARMLLCQMPWDCSAMCRLFELPRSGLRGAGTGAPGRLGRPGDIQPARQPASLARRGILVNRPFGRDLI